MSEENPKRMTLKLSKDETPSYVTRVAPLIQQAAELLDRAQTPIDIANARNVAITVYAVARAAMRLARLNNAKHRILLACQEAMNEALELECRAKIQLAQGLASEIDDRDVGRAPLSEETQ